MEKKRIIARNEFKNVRGGWSRYFLPDLIFNEIYQSEADKEVTSKPTREPTRDDARRRRDNINISFSSTEDSDVH